jgi:alpha-tubulin suppressor-like RCC1 family protein
MPVRLAGALLTVGIGLVFVAVTFTARANAHAPHSGLNFSIAIDVNGDSTNDCDTNGGSTTCAIAPGATFVVKWYLNSLPSAVADYAGIQARLTYTGITSKNNASMSAWPDCDIPVSQYPAGEVDVGCVTLPPDSSYTGLVGTIGFTCTSGPSSGNAINMLHGLGSYDTSLLEDTTHAEGNGTSESLTINCSGPTATHTRTPTRTPTYTPTRTPTFTATSTACATNCPTPTPTIVPAAKQQRIAAGFGHTCIINSSGGVQCWGDNQYGQLGNGTTTDSPDPVSVIGLTSGVAAIGAAEFLTCALTTSGAVKCWGDNFDGQVGDGTAGGIRTSPVTVSGLTSGVIALSVGMWRHNCVVTAAGNVKCWGNNDFSQIGDGTGGTGDIGIVDDYRATPTLVCAVGGCGGGALSGIVSVSAGAAHTCALTTTGAMKCWGWNLFSQLGDGTTTQRNAPVNVNGKGSGVARIAAGLFDTCAVTTARALKCWGDYASIQSPDVPGLGSGVATVSMGTIHTCAVTTAGAVQCWGSNGSGQLGDGTTSDSTYYPVGVVGLDEGVVSVTAAAGVHTCAFTVQDVLLCWGSNRETQLGIGITSYRPSPVEVQGLGAAISAIGLGGQHSCAITNAGGLKCWGLSNYGQLGSTTAADFRPLPGDVAGLGTTVTSVVGGDQQTCALTAAGGVKCWGNGSTTPSDVSGLTSGVTMIAAGRLHTCALVGGGVKCWGTNTSGQLGNGTLVNSGTPVNVSGLSSGVAAISSGGRHTCALNTGGGVKCWGENEFGQVGDGSTTDRNTPADVSSLSSGIAAVATGGDHTCAVTTGGGVKCWGNNQVGQGGGSSADSCEVAQGGVGGGTVFYPCNQTPADVSDLASGVASLVAGREHTCALMTSGGVKCLGSNAFGELGRGSTTNSSSAGDVLGLTSGVASIAAGERHTCALLSSGSVKCWGWNFYGQLGDGTAGIALTPVVVRVAGTPNTPGFSGDGGQAQNALVNKPYGVFVTGGGGGGGEGEAAGTSTVLYFADAGNNRVRAIGPVDPTGTITTFAGGGSGCSGPAAPYDGCLRTQATLNGPRDVYVQGQSLYIADTENCRIRRVDLTTNVISTVAGTGTCGYTGDDGAATMARLNKPTGVAVGPDGSLYIADRENHRIRKVVPEPAGDGIVDGDAGELITTVAGTGTAGSLGDHGPATAAQLRRPHDVYLLLPTEDLLIADTDNNKIRRIDYPSGIITTMAGTGVAGYGGDGAQGTGATLSGPEAIAAQDYRVVVADTDNNVIRQIDALTGIITTVAGGTASTGEDLLGPKGIVPSAEGALIIANTEAETIVASGINLEGGRSSTFTPAHSCTVLPGISSIDWVLPAFLLASIAMRRRVTMLFTFLSKLLANGAWVRETREA